MSDITSPEKSPWGWKSLIISAILSCIFLGIFYLAVTSEPDYMPSQNKPAHNHQAASGNEAAQQGPTAAEMNMTEKEHVAHGGQTTENTPLSEEAHQKAHEANQEHGH